MSDTDEILAAVQRQGSEIKRLREQLENTTPKTEGEARRQTMGRLRQGYADSKPEKAKKRGERDGR